MSVTLRTRVHGDKGCARGAGWGWGGVLYRFNVDCIESGNRFRHATGKYKQFACGLPGTGRQDAVCKPAYFSSTVNRR
jgi:hypothetical protein